MKPSMSESDAEVGVGDGASDCDEAGDGDGLGATVGVLPDLAGCGLARVAGPVCCAPVRTPTVVPPPLRPQMSASSGLPAATSNTVMAASASTNTPKAAASRARQRGQ